jgi:hypothetical protein
MATRRRPESEFQNTPDQPGVQLVTLAGFNGGYNGYTSPELLSPQFWAGCSNVYSGQHGLVRRARMAPVFNTTVPGYVATGARITSMFAFFPIGNNPFVIFDNGNTTFPNSIWTSVYGIAGAGGPIGVGFIYIGGSPSASILNGPFMRYTATPALILQSNGLIRSKLFWSSPANSFYLEYWGLDTADSSPQITLAAGTTGSIVAATGASRASNIVTMTLTAPLPANLVVGAFVNIAGVTDTTFNSATGTAFQVLSIATPSFTYFQVGPNATSGGGTATVQITKSVGRSYAFAWENANTGHLSAPSPASEYVAYSNQTGTIDCIQPGTVAINNTSTTLTGTNTAFTSAWVGRGVWIEGVTTSNPFTIVSVTSATQLTITPAWAQANVAGKRFQIYDLQATHLRLYATGDGGSVYLRVARNAFFPLLTNLVNNGLEFVDTANSEPPNSPFTSEIVQNYNVPPPIGDALFDYQGRVGVYGVPAALQSFFYSNIEATAVGQPPESFAPLNQVTLPIGEARLNGTAYLPTGMMMWSSKQDMFKLTGLLQDNTVSNQFQLGATIQRLPYKIGSASRFGTAVTPLGAIWFSSDREVQLFTDHYAPKNVGRPIQDVLNSATRINFAKAKYYKAGDRNWFCLAITVGAGTFNNKLCILDLDLLASNGQASYFTFDMATNQPSWYLYDVNCEAIEAAIDSVSTNHLLTGDVDLITDIDWQPAYYTVGVEQAVVNANQTLHALGNDAPHMIKTMEWLRCNTNQLPKNIAAQGWKWNVLAYDDDQFVLGVLAQTIPLVPGIDSQSNVAALQYSPAKFVLGATRSVRGRRFQLQTIFPSGPGFWELRSFPIKYTNVAPG